MYIAYLTLDHPVRANMSASVEDRLPEDELIAQMRFVTSYSHDELHPHCISSTFMFAGHDTTSSAISRILHCLAENQEEQEKLRQDIIASGVVDGESVSYDELMAVPYLDAVCRETLRVCVIFVLSWDEILLNLVL